MANIRAGTLYVKYSYGLIYLAYYIPDNVSNLLAVRGSGGGSNIQTVISKTPSNPTQLQFQGSSQLAYNVYPYIFVDNDDQIVYNGNNAVYKILAMMIECQPTLSNPGNLHCMITQDSKGFLTIPFGTNLNTEYVSFEIYKQIDLVSTINLTINATNQQQISVNGVNYNTFPQTLTISGDTTITATGNPNRTITLQNEQNLKQVQIGSTIYNNFPVSIPISADTIIRISGKDDPQITVDYTHTTVPIVTNI